MAHPESGGAVHTVRSLARATGVSWSKIHRLITEERPTVTRDQADRIANAVQVNRKALFTPTSSPFGDANEGKGV
ncbi:helix-turn-helix transcriptional regulator [Streptomyces sp. NPDC049577]|uniref:helix-turn-helix domain-containing protein n=1 Tax=Streptomyces sp. NPDC049577 TaxID=3155153 RepID=UPI00341A119B